MADYGISPIMQFRLSYLRAIADAWEDQNGNYFKNLVWKGSDSDYKDPKKQEAHDIFRLKSNLKYFWNPPENPPKDPCRCPWWVKINIVYRKNGPLCLDGITWSGPEKTDTFIIYLPQAPKNKDLWSEALSAYYQKFPTLFGNLTPPGYPEEISTHDVGAESTGGEGEDVSGKYIAPTSPIGVSGNEPIDFIDFGGVTLKVIAKAWAESEYMDKLTAPHKTLADLQDSKTPKHIQAILGTVLKEAYPGYSIPWNFDVVFLKDTQAEYTKDSGNIYKWLNLSKNVIQLNFPHKPEASNVGLEPLALAAYNATGPKYPLTCY